MTQFSWPWTCTNVGDGGTDSYSLDVIEMTNRLTANNAPTTDGVIYWVDTTVLPFTGFVNASDGLLEPTNPAGSTVRIASGVGHVKGWMYANDDDVDFDISADLGNANATDIIVLQKNRTNQQVRIARIKGDAGTTATVTQNATVWEVKLAEVALTAGGDFSSLTDTRERVKTSDAGIVLLETLSPAGVATITSSQIPPLFTDLLVVTRAQQNGNAAYYLHMRMNSVVTNYRNHYIKLNNTTVTGNSYIAAVSILAGPVGSDFNGLENYSSSEIKIFDYARLRSATDESVPCHIKGGGDTVPSNPMHINGRAAAPLVAGDNVDTLTFLMSTSETVIAAANFVSGDQIEIYGIW